MPMSINRSSQGPVFVPVGQGENISALGVNLVFKVVGAQSAGEWLAMEYTAPPGFSGPAVHWHKFTTEIFYVLEGVLNLQIGETTHQAGPGGFAYIPPRTIHTFSNPGDGTCKFFLVASPAGLENYFNEMLVYLKEEPSWPPKDMNKVIALMARYDTFMPPVV